MSGWVIAATGLAVALAALAAWGARWAYRLLRGTWVFLGDWQGQPARPGVEARPGVMTRLGAVEKGMSQLLAETRPNAGHTMRDVIQRIREDVSDVKREQAEVRKELGVRQREEGDH